MTDVSAAVARIEALLDGFHEREKAEELVRSLMEVYGAGLERMLEIAKDTPLAGEFANDKLVASLLLIHGLHPVDAETRIRRALKRLGEADVEVSGGVARVSLLRHVPASTVERLVRESAPEIEQVEVEGTPEPLVQIACNKSSS